MPNFFQLMHPGLEPAINHAHPNYCPPNQGPTHKRKFLRTINGGDYVDSAGALQNGNLTFWGEWEPGSSVSKLPGASTHGMPQYLHTPNLSLGVSTPSLSSGKCGSIQSSCVSAPAGLSVRYCPSTDPFIFCDPMLYFHCHINVPNGKLNKLQTGDIYSGPRFSDNNLRW